MKIPDAAIKRLSYYYRALQPLMQQGTRQLSSRTLAEILALNPAQVRKDLSYFGSFGKRGTGYDVAELSDKLAEILGISKEHRVAIVGAGNLGTALAAYRGFNVFGFEICALFDIDKNKIGKKIRGIPCYSISELKRIVSEEKIDMVVFSVPTETAQQVANLLVESGIRAILNFTQVRLNVPAEVKVNNVDMALELKSLSYFVSQVKKR